MGEREKVRERAPAVIHFQQRMTRARRGFTIDFTFYKNYHYNAYVINVYGRFVLYFHLHYQVIPKIACVFSKPYEVRISLIEVCLLLNKSEEKSIFGDF